MTAVRDLINVRKEHKSLHLEGKVSGVECVFRETFDFDTEEAAIAWYNDIQYAKFINTRPKESTSSAFLPPPPGASEEEVAASLNPDMLEEDGVKASIPLECIESYDLISISMVRLNKLIVHTAGGELDDVSFTLPFSNVTEDGKKKLEQLEYWRAVRRREAKARSETYSKIGAGEQKDGAHVEVELRPQIVLQFGSSLNWLMPNTDTVPAENVMKPGKCPIADKSPEVILKAVFAIPSDESMWGK